MTPTAGEIWLADRGDEQRRLVFVISDERFERLAGRVLVAPVLDAPAAPRPWHVRITGDRVVAVHLLATASVDRLLERAETTPYEVLRRVRHAVGAITG